jgi:hypothetical protein
MFTNTLNVCTEESKVTKEILLVLASRGTEDRQISNNMLVKVDR